jgi:multicomponent Na+:H+ antiporter subunit E
MSDSLSASRWSQPLRLFAFLGWFLWQFVLTSLQVVGLILTPGRKAKPGIVRMSIDGLSELEVTILVILITITPDTLVIAVDREKGVMFVHGMFVAGDPEGFRDALSAGRDRLLFGVRSQPDLSLRRRAAA